jgi:hypothetical protein
LILLTFSRYKTASHALTATQLLPLRSGREIAGVESKRAAAARVNHASACHDFSTTQAVAPIDLPSGPQTKKAA